MEKPRILVLGGYGHTGRLIAELLLAETGASLVLAGRNIEKAEATSAELNRKSGRARVTATRVDASDISDLRQAFRSIDLVVVASSTSEFARQVASAALEARIDYFDVQYSTHKAATLISMAAEIKAAGRCFITDGGFHPGLPAALVRFAAPLFDHLQSANVGSVIKIDWASLQLSRATVEEFVGEFMSFQPICFQDGAWREVGLLSMMVPEWMEFGYGFGRQYCIPMFMEEMRPLPELYPELQETGFFVGGFNWFVDWLLSPLLMLGLKIAPQRSPALMASWMDWGLRTFSKPPYGTLLKLEAQGIKDDQPLQVEVSVYHQDGYVLTAIPVVACLLQYLDGSIRQPGLWFQALAVEPVRFMVDIERLGAELKINK